MNLGTRERRNSFIGLVAQRESSRLAPGRSEFESPPIHQFFDNLIAGQGMALSYVIARETGR